jgi:hypothetical protein
MTVEVIDRARYIKVDQSANLRAGSVNSKIWLHGDEYRSLNNRLLNKHWRYRHYKGNKLFKVSSVSNINTSHVLRYLNNKHNINVREKAGNDKANTLSTTTTLPTTTTTNTIPSLFISIRAVIKAARDGFRALVSVIDAENLRWMLIKWIVFMHIALSVIKNRYFRELFITITPALK